MRLGTSRFDRFVLYAAFVACLAGGCVHFARVVAAQSMALAAEHVADWSQPTQPSRVERRTVEVASARSAPPAVTQGPVFPDAPDLTLKELVVQLDIAERFDLKGKEKTPRKAARPVKLADARAARSSAADVFGRSFGVLLASVE